MKILNRASHLADRPRTTPLQIRELEILIEHAVGMLGELTIAEYDPGREREIGEQMLHELELELAERDRKRRELWGDKFPPRLNQKPPPGFTPPPTPINREKNGVVAGGEMAEGNKGGKGKKMEKGKKEKSKQKVKTS